MIGVDAHTVTLEVKRVLTELGVTELVLVQVWPSPYSGIDDMGKPLASRNLNNAGGYETTWTSETSLYRTTHYLMWRKWCAPVVSNTAQPCIAPGHAMPCHATCSATCNATYYVGITEGTEIGLSFSALQSGRTCSCPARQYYTA